MLDSVIIPTKALVCSAILSVVTLAGCSSSSSTPITEGAEPEISSGSNILADQVANDASLGKSVLKLTDIVTSGSLRALAQLNQAYVSGILVEERLDCIDEDAGAPVLEYYCGEDGVGERLNDFGYPAFVLSVEDNAQCRDALMNNNDTERCTLNYSDSEQAGEWYVKYSLSSVDGMDVETMTLSDGVVPEFIDLSLAGSVCEIKIIDDDVIEFNDEPTCRVSVAQVLAILQTP